VGGGGTVQRGWNVYHREQMQLKQMTPDEYGKASKKNARKWKRIPEEEKATYHTRAALEQQQRHVPQLIQT
jgi:hypothetical protein